MEKRHKTMKSSCAKEIDISLVRRPNRSAFYKHKGDFRWHGIKDTPYKPSGNEWTNIMRRVLIGSRGESTRFHVRYFEITSNGQSSLEIHKHEHVVICVKGKGIVRTGRTKRKMEFMDVLYISPNTLHQLTNPFRKPFGFLCMVNAKRDKPKPFKR
jgi:ribulose-bisphosphate carboxylase large chain